MKTNKSTITGLHNVIPLQIHYLQEGEESRKAYIFHQGLLGITLRGHKGIVHQQWEWRTSLSLQSWIERSTTAEYFNWMQAIHNDIYRLFTADGHRTMRLPVYALFGRERWIARCRFKAAEAERNDTEHLNRISWAEKRSGEKKVLNSHVQLWKLTVRWVDFICS